jgi:hypothetical protein
MAKFIVKSLDECIELGVGATYLNRADIVARDQSVMAALERFID